MWKDIISHKIEIDILRSYILNQKIPHALLFSGLKGIGKSMVALEFFKALNCLESPGDACGLCSSCIKANNLRHPDLIRIVPEGSEIKVEHVRQVIGELGLRPFEARQRVIIVEPAESLNKSSSNALLKTLEEPPKSTIIILISHKPGLLLPTIISRCQELSFKPIDPKESGININPIILKLTSGSLGGLTDSDAEYVNIIRNTIIGVIEGSDPFNAAEKISKEDCDLLIVLMVIESFVRDLMLINLNPDCLINEELLRLNISRVDYLNLENIILKLNEIRSMKDSSISIKNSLSAIFYEIGSLVRNAVV